MLIEVYTPLEEKVGMVRTATSFSYTKEMDKAGSFSFIVPVVDDKASAITIKSRVKVFEMLENARREILYGIVSKITTTLDDKGGVNKKIEGMDILDELGTRSVGFLSLKNGDAGLVTSSAIANILAGISGWSRTVENGTDIYASFAGETALAALVKVAETTGEHFIIQPNKTLKWFHTLESSGLRVIKPGKGTFTDNTNIAFITSITEDTNAFEVISKIYPYGAGNGSERLDLYWYDTYNPLVLPPHYVINKTFNSLENTNTTAQYGLIEKHLSWKEIGPISNSDADLAVASNYLLYAAWQHLEKHKEPQIIYDIKLTKLDKVIEPGQTVRVIYRGVIEDNKFIDIDKDLVVLSVSYKSGSNGVFTSDVKLSTIDRQPRDSLEAIVGSMEQGNALTAHPQMGLCYYMLAFGKLPVDTVFGNDVSFRMGKEITYIRHAFLRIKTAPFESTAKAAIDGGYKTVTSEGGSSHSHNVMIPGHEHHVPLAQHQHEFTVPDHQHEFDIPDHQHEFDVPDHQHSFTLPNHDHKFDIPSHVHTVSIEGHTHKIEIPGHSHKIYVQEFSSVGALQPLYLSIGGQFAVVNPPGSFPTGEVGGAVASENTTEETTKTQTGGKTGSADSRGGLTDHPTNIDGQLSGQPTNTDGGLTNRQTRVKNQNVLTGEPTKATEENVTELSDLYLGSYSSTVYTQNDVQTSYSEATHNHNVTLPNHGHDLKYGVFRDNTYPQGVQIKVNDNTVYTVGNQQSATDLEVEISQFINFRNGELNRIELTKTTEGMGTVELSLRMLVTIQDIILT